MSVQYTEEKRTVNRIQSITCSRCKKVMSSDNFVEWQELQTIMFTGGYGSVFGDGVSIRVDLCQNCLFDLVKDFAEYGD